MTGGAVMVCGTASDVGKSQIVAGLCRWLQRRGKRVAPFKGQNMANNSFVTESGHEIGRSQAYQAGAARVPPEVAMNPVLLKPMGDQVSQLIVLGEPVGELTALEFHRTKGCLLPTVLGALDSLRRRFDTVVLEGAGSPAEPNLMDHDLVNLGLATTSAIPAVLVGDIERGGVFASLVGTMALLPEPRRRQVAGFVINKFRGDATLLEPALEDLEARTGVACLGVLPHGGRWFLDAEDSLAAPSPGRDRSGRSAGDRLDVAVCRLPLISNFTDIDPLALEPGVAVRFVDTPASLGDPDLIVLPGSRITVTALRWLRRTRLDGAIAEARRRGSAVLGICAGFQMLGRHLSDRVESGAGEVEGLGWLPVVTHFEPEKLTRRRNGRAGPAAVSGFEIRHGRPVAIGPVTHWFELDDRYGQEPEGVADANGVWATSLHGVLEEDQFRMDFLTQVARRRAKRFVPGHATFAAGRERQIDAVADLLDAHVDLAAVDRLIEAGRP